MAGLQQRERNRNFNAIFARSEAKRGETVPIYTFRLFQVDYDYYGGEDGSILAETTLDIFDTDGSLHQQPSSDPDNDQTFSIGGGPHTSDYQVDFEDFSVINGSGPEFELFAFEVSAGGPNDGYYVFSKDPGFNPSPGDDLTVSNYSIFTITDYGDIESSICFARGTYIRTACGERLIEDLRAGDHVATFDHGLQPIEWISHRIVKRADLERNPALLPVVFKPGTCGNSRTLILSQQHAIHTQGLGHIARAFPDHLLRAKHAPDMIGGKARIACGCRRIEYFHLLLPKHELIWANGALAESLRLAPQSLAMLSPQALASIRSVRKDMPRHLTRESADRYMPSVRPVLKRSQLRSRPRFKLAG